MIYLRYVLNNRMKKEITSQPDMLYHDACLIIEQAKAVAFKAVNDTLIKRNWLLGMRIQHALM